MAAEPRQALFSVAAPLMLDNYTAEQIAGELGCTRRTVQRKLLVICRTWQAEIAGDELTLSGSA